MAAVAAAEQSAEQFRGQAKLLFLPVADAVPRLSSFRPPATDAATPGSDSSYPTPTSIPPPPTSLPSTPTPVAVWRTVASVDNASPPSRLRSGTPTALMPTAPLRLQIDAADAHHTHHQVIVVPRRIPPLRRRRIPRPRRLLRCNPCAAGDPDGSSRHHHRCLLPLYRLYFECQQTYSCIMADITNKLLLPNYRRTIDDKLFQRKRNAHTLRPSLLYLGSPSRSSIRLHSFSPLPTQSLII
ncbi:uncharacterized protein [Oryza sativa Japonica Group]|uniref:uncharacterized protein isoform X1 n=1 Tax=Oryza sativa subsp. japonica TaxID=39947 RepID=UPI000E1BAE20|nr:uncharacterized protein LOC9270771 [Oryza sativa Japonica Group]